MRLLIKSGRVYSQGVDRKLDLRIERGRVSHAASGLAPRPGEVVVDASDLLLLPGLINGHDHLGLDLFPRLGNPPYENFYQWAEEIYHPDRSPLRDVLAIPLHLRLAWGGYRNLMAGVTTVAHHDPLYPYLRGGLLRQIRKWLGEAPFPIKIVEPYCFSHSLGFGPPAKEALDSGSGPFLIHAAEGIDKASANELDQLEQSGVLGGRTVLIHAIAVSERSIAKLEQSKSSVVWCPESNLFLYSKTAPVDRLLGRVEVALGTDSTLSGAPNLLDELRAAAATGLCHAEQLLEMVTSNAARIFRLNDGRGTLEPGSPADLMMLPELGSSPGQTLLAARPEDLKLVLLNGQPRIAAGRGTATLPEAMLAGLETLPAESSAQGFVAAEQLRLPTDEDRRFDPGLSALLKRLELFPEALAAQRPTSRS